MGWEAVVATHPGKLRTRNEDSLLDRSADCLWVIADGMGGHQAGEFASSRLTNSLMKVPMNGLAADSIDAVEDVILRVNGELVEYSRSALDGKTIGCTVVALSLGRHMGWVLWAGDSRLYRVRGRTLELLTEDHTHAAELLRSGKISEDTARQYPSNVITRAVGVAPELHLDCAIFALAPQDRFLLCTDGLYNSLDPQQIARQMRQGPARQIADALLASCLLGEARDNISLIVLCPG